MALLTYYPWLYPLAAAVFGLIAGSFLNVVILRLPVMMERQWRADCAECFPGHADIGPQPVFNLSVPASSCPHCQHKIRAWENIPVISWILLRGRCSQCKAKISARYPAIEILTALMALAVALVLPFSAWSLAVIGAGCTLIALTFIDIDKMLLPDQLTLPLMWAGLLLALLDISPVSLESAVIGAMAGYLSLWSLYWVFKLLTGKEGMGYGDFKLLAALGAWAGWQLLPLIVLLSSLLGAICGIILLRMQHSDNEAGMQTPFSFGPYLALAGWIALLWGPPVLHWYVGTYLGYPL
ncbi:A24 family peptidase [Photobacterium sp. TLY01]|uniref:prepilin peptidase n=1 Tax=Photobacterium sp. TLY01 TaxID=2907534 RepID=UPI001F21820F|nr:A24 family peptidase [Photobacterium sp. TLY01]UIP28332.1 A24 family peptidase [Photobacterium sp. TLY01]